MNKYYLCKKLFIWGVALLLCGAILLGLASVLPSFKLKSYLSSFNLESYLPSLFKGKGKGKEDTLLIGSLLALSGPNKSFGINQKRGLDIALREINVNGGINDTPLEIVYGDTRLDEDKGLQEYKRLTLEKSIKAIVGVTGSGVALKLAPYAERDEVVLLSSLDTSPKLTLDGGSFFFRNIASDAYSGKVVADWALENQQTKAVLIYNSENAWALGCLDAISSAIKGRPGIELVHKPIAVLDSTDNFATVLIAFKEKTVRADSVYVCLMGRQAGLFVKQAVQSNFNATFYGTDAFSQQEFIDNAGETAEYSKFIMPAEANNNSYEVFAAKYNEEFGEQADTVAAKAYDALNILVMALKKLELGEIKGKELQNELRNTSYSGVTGINSFDENGDLKQADFERFTYKNGEMFKLN